MPKFVSTLQKIYYLYTNHRCVELISECISEKQAKAYTKRGAK